MTICVLQFLDKSQQFRCYADTRIRVGEGTATDSGGKILPAPVAAYTLQNDDNFIKSAGYTFGFAFAGSTLAAINTHALATACSQSLTKKDGSEPDPPEISLEELAELFRRSAEHYILEMSSRAAKPGQPIDTRFFFQSVVFGFCPRSQAFKAFGITPNIGGDRVKVIIADMEVSDGACHPLGDRGTIDTHAKIRHELKESGRDSSVVATMLEHIDREEYGNVGGHLQIGVADRNGFQLCPVLTPDGGAHFLGVNVEGESPLTGYRIGFHAFMPDALA